LRLSYDLIRLRQKCDFQLFAKNVAFETNSHSSVDKQSIKLKKEKVKKEEKGALSCMFRYS